MESTAAAGSTVRPAPSPQTGDEVTSKQELARLFALQQAHRWTMARTTAKERIARLNRLRDATLLHRKEIADAVHLDFRKAHIETDLTELQPLLLELQHVTANLEEWLEPKAVKTPLLMAGTRSELRLEPKGVVLVLGPWNYPFQLVVMPVIAAIAAGNTVIARPSEKVPHTARVLRKVLSAAFDEREVALVTGDIDLADALLELPFDHIFFTGSTKVGKKVMAKAAEHLASVTLELGGKSPTIIDDTAELRGAAERVVWGKFINAGQTCIAPDYVLVHEKVQGAFIEALRDAIQRAYGHSEEARKASSDLARIIDLAAFKRLKSLFDEAVQMGARVEVGGQMDPDHRYISPTVISGVSPSASIMKEEIFGPILPILSWRSWDEVFSLIQRLGKPLALYIFSREEKHIEEVLRGTTAGGTSVNNVVLHFVNQHLPFGGVGPSGMGAYHGEAGIRAFSNERGILHQGRFVGIRAFFPPYTDRTSKLVRWVERLFT